MLTDRTASPPAWAPGYRVQACRSGESALAAEASWKMRASDERSAGFDADICDL